jgi:hypothetical protein
MGQGAPLSRRALLAATLGAPALMGLSACSRDEPRRFDGGWLGVSHTRGHRLRSPTETLDSFPQTASQRVDVLVVGAGIAGLACARALVRSGVDDIVVLELEQGPGGNSRGHRLGDSGCPMGAHYLPLPGPHAHEVRELLFDLGLLRSVAGRDVPDERHLCHSPQERLFFEGVWHDGLLPPAAPHRAQRRSTMRSASMNCGATWRRDARAAGAVAPCTPPSMGRCSGSGSRANSSMTHRCAGTSITRAATTMAPPARGGVGVGRLALLREPPWFRRSATMPANANRCSLA